MFEQKLTFINGDKDDLEKVIQSTALCLSLDQVYVISYQTDIHSPSCLPRFVYH